MNYVKLSISFFLYSTGTRLENPGDAYNWNSAGYFDLQILAGRYTVKWLTNSVMVLPGKCND